MYGHVITDAFAFAVPSGSCFDARGKITEETIKRHDRRLQRGASAELSVGWVDPWVELNRVYYSTSANIFEMVMLVHLKHG